MTQLPARFIVPSSDEGAELELRAETVGAWRVSLRRPFVAVTEAPISAPPDLRQDLGAFFAELAQDWRGWEGERRYSSLDEDLQLRCTHDGVGVVTITVELVLDGMGQEWAVIGRLAVDPGRLEALATQAARFNART